MPPIDYPGARQRLYVVRELQDQSADDMLGSGFVRGTFLGIYRDHTPEAAILTAQQDHQKSFARGPVICTDLSAWARLVSFETSTAVWVVLHPDGQMEYGALTLGSPVVTAAQRVVHLRLKTA
jgi:hypothetical protein